MIIKRENEKTPLMKNVFIENENFYVSGWYGGDYIEIFSPKDNCVIHMNKDEFKQLYSMMSAMMKEF